MSSEHPQQEQAARYAACLRERFETQGMLAELVAYPNFVVWRYTVVDGQRKKPPFNPNTNLPASPIEPRTWGALDSALAAVATGKFQGIGFMLSQSPFSGIDLDHCIKDGSIEPWAQEIVAALDTYTEYSPSWNKAAGTGGVHLLVAGKPPASKKQATSKCTEKSTISRSPPTTSKEHREPSITGKQSLTHCTPLLCLFPPQRQKFRTQGGGLAG